MKELRRIVSYDENVVLTQVHRKVLSIFGRTSEAFQCGLVAILPKFEH